MKPEIWFEKRGGRGPLCIHWLPGPYGDAIEDQTENGHGYFAPNGELLAAYFDDVSAKSDHQILKFSNGLKSYVEVWVNKGKVRVKLGISGKIRKKAA